MKITETILVVLLGGGSFVMGSLLYEGNYVHPRKHLYEPVGEAVYIIPENNAYNDWKWDDRVLYAKAKKRPAVRKRSRSAPSQASSGASFAPQSQPLFGKQHARRQTAGTPEEWQNPLQRLRSENTTYAGSVSGLLAGVNTLSRGKSRGGNAEGSGAGAFSASGQNFAMARPFTDSKPFFAAGDDDDMEDGGGIPPPEGTPVGGGGFILAALATMYALLRKGTWRRLLPAVRNR